MESVGFLLGSGASLKAGLPSTTCITKRVLSGKDVCGRAGGYCIAPGGGGSQAAQVEKNLKLLRLVNQDVMAFHGRLYGRATTYEDLYWVIQQICDSIMEEYENAALEPFIDRTLQKLAPVVWSRYDLSSLAGETCNYIRDVVWRMVEHVPESDLCYLSFLKDVYEDDRVSRLSLFTLNHDTVIERYWRGQDIQCVDGFGDPENGVRYWEPRLFEHESCLRLLKLHGSVDWFRYNMNGSTRFASVVGPFDHIKDPAGKDQVPEEYRPEILVGTFNKMLDYSREIFGELFRSFESLLSGCDRIVVSGYGFGDKGINTRIVEWFDGGGTRRMAVVHPDPEGLLAGARGAIEKHWKDWRRMGKICVVKEKIENTCWKDIRRALDGE